MRLLLATFLIFIFTGCNCTCKDGFVTIYYIDGSKETVLTDQASCLYLDRGCLVTLQRCGVKRFEIKYIK